MILIKQAQIVDGSGAKSFRGDILINNQNISAIGAAIKKKADQTIDGLGLTAVPGFIDVNTDSDHHLSLFTNPSQKDFIAQGVTTIIGGQCGASLAPLMYGSLASLEEWSHANQVNVDWNSVKSLFNILQKIKLGIRFETLVGHATIKRDIIGDTPKDLTDSETQVFSQILENALKDGALGLSTGLGHVYGKNTPYNEIRNLVKIVASHNKIYATHLRDEKEGLLKSIEETLLIAKDTGAKTIISHFRPVAGFEKEFIESLSLMDKNLNETNIYFDVNPFGTSLIPVSALLPAWAQNPSHEIMLGHLSSANIKEGIVREMALLKLENLKVIDAVGHDYLVGKTLGEISRNRDKNLIETALELMRITNFRMMLASENLDADLLINMLFHQKSLIGSNSASLPEYNNKRIKLERETSTFSKFLEITASRNISIEEAIKKITSFPAQVFGLKNRGLIKEGYAADIVLLKDQKINSVILNGNQILNNG